MITFMSSIFHITLFIICKGVLEFYMIDSFILCMLRVHAIVTDQVYK
jgi:hypothetical protein